METNTSNKGKGDGIIKKFYWKEICKRKVKKGIIPCYKHLWSGLSVLQGVFIIYFSGDWWLT